MKEFMEPTVGVGGCLQDHRQKKNPVLVIFFLSGNMTCDSAYVLHLLHSRSKYCTQWCTNCIDDLLYTFI